jgi:hypothetical protein
LPKKITGTATFDTVDTVSKETLSKATQGELLSKPDRHLIPIPRDSVFMMFHFNLDALVNRRGRYNVYFEHKGNISTIGAIHFHYVKAPPLTPDQIKAIESDPNSVKLIKLILGCKFCPSKLKTYTGFSRSAAQEREGCVWQTDLASEFACSCGRNKYSLEYLKESMHGMLLKDFSTERTGLSYVRQYAHSQVQHIVMNFTQLLDRELLEQPVQEFIENHSILLSRFHAK